jgi:hypothetical protein
MNKLEKKALAALLAWLKTGIYRGGTAQEGALLDAAIALEAKRSGKTQGEVLAAVLAVPSPIEQHLAALRTARCPDPDELLDT